MSAVEILHVPLTSPCPVPVTPDGRAWEGDEPLPMERRVELCAVDASWMIGAQRICDVHLREILDRGLIDGSFEGLLEEVAGRPITEQERDERFRPWSKRHRYSQEEARDWAERAKEHGLA